MWLIRKRIMITGVLTPGPKFFIDTDEGERWHVALDRSKRTFYFKRVHATGYKGCGQYIP